MLRTLRRKVNEHAVVGWKTEGMSPWQGCRQLFPKRRNGRVCPCPTNHRNLKLRLFRRAAREAFHSKTHTERDNQSHDFQFADRPLLPLRPGLPERQTYDYKRYGTTTLLAAFNILNRKVMGSCLSRHRSREF